MKRIAIIFTIFTAMLILAEPVSTSTRAATEKWVSLRFASTNDLTAHTARKDNPHGVTAAQIGALTAEVDPVASPRLDLIEPETNKWNAAYVWGDHALAGYLLPADLAAYATTQQVAEAVSGAVTNLNLYAVPVAGGKHELWMKE